MSKRILAALGTACIALLLPAASFGQNRNCGKSGSSTSSMRTPNFQGGGCGKPNMPFGPSSFNMPTGLRGFGRPNFPMGFQQNPQLQMGMLMNQQFQMGMLQQVNQQNMLQNQLKQQLLMYAIDAPTENLQRGLKNSDPFVRWAASVELNRRWKTETAVAKKTERATRLSMANEPVRAAAPAPALQRFQTNTPAVVTPVSQTLLLQMGIPK